MIEMKLRPIVDYANGELLQQYGYIPKAKKDNRW